MTLKETEDWTGADVVVVSSDSVTSLLIPVVAVAGVVSSLVTTTGFWSRDGSTSFTSMLWNGGYVCPDVQISRLTVVSFDGSGDSTIHEALKRLAQCI